MTLAVYFCCFESLVGYRNALRSRPGTYKGLQFQRSGDSGFCLYRPNFSVREFQRILFV